MLPMPDFSYFSVPGFIPQIRSYPNQTSSLILHNKDNDQWDSVLRQKDADPVNPQQIQTYPRMTVIFRPWGLKAISTDGGKSVKPSKTYKVLKISSDLVLR